MPIAEDLLCRYFSNVERPTSMITEHGEVHVGKGAESWALAQGRPRQYIRGHRSYELIIALCARLLKFPQHTRRTHPRHVRNADDHVKRYSM